MKRDRVIYWLVILFILIAAGLGIPAAIKWGTKPRCYACNHFRHEHRMCGWMMDSSGGTCICEKDK